MISRIAILLSTVVGMFAVACVDMSAPKGAASISVLRAPAPVVVLGDTMRDSTGAVAPLDVIAYDANGNPVAGPTPQFFITDTGAARTARLVGDRVIVGDKIGLVHVIGQVGGLQTPVATIHVSYAPTRIDKLGADTALVAPIGPDSASTIGRVTLPVSLKAANDSAAQGFVVKYTIVRAPATRSDKGSPAVFIADDQGNIARSDTSDASGASRKLVVISNFFADSLLRAGKKTDTAIVEVSASYKGAAIGGSPVRFIIPVTSSFGK